MDLTERGSGTVRHPWEVQRFEAYRRVLADHGVLRAKRVLDVGAGDGWFSDRLIEHLEGGTDVVCWDVNYDDNDLEPSHRQLHRTRDRPTAGYDLVMLLDVLEHIDDPDAFIESELAPLTSPGTAVLVAVPAHQRLYSAHDEALGHHRRYASRELLRQVAPWLDVVEQGSLFTSLLLPRAVSVVVEQISPDRAANADHGVGHWTGGPLLTATANRVLEADARLGRALRRAHIRLPGLSHWLFGVTR